MKKRIVSVLHSGVGLLLKAGNTLDAKFKLLTSDRLHDMLEEYLTLRTAAWAALKILDSMTLTPSEQLVRTALRKALEDPASKE